MNLNKVFLIGRVTADIQLRATPGGQNVAAFSIATNRTWTDKMGKRQEDTEFHNLVVWGRQAEIANQFLNKGGMVLVEGRLQTRSWQDKQGQQRKTTEIVVERLQLGPRSGGGAGGSTAGSSGARPAAPADDDGGWGTAPTAATVSTAALPDDEIPIINIDDDEAPGSNEIPF